MDVIVIKLSGTRDTSNKIEFVRQWLVSRKNYYTYRWSCWHTGWVMTVEFVDEEAAVEFTLTWL